jgi:hypothetical protein
MRYCCQFGAINVVIDDNFEAVELVNRVFKRYTGIID